MVNSFAKKYKSKTQITTFNTMNEAMTKLRAGLSYDVLVGATVDTLGQIVESKLAQPLNHSYIPNITQAWPDFTNPFYDQGWQYTVPYTIYTTGIAWRKDLINKNPYAMKNPWSMLWQPKYKGRIAILDDTGRDQPRPDEERPLRPQCHRPPRSPPPARRSKSSPG